MDAKVFRLTILTIISAFILVAVIIYATNADRIGRMFGNGDKNEATENASVEEQATDEAAYGQQIGDDLKAFLYDDDFFDEAEEVPAVVVILNKLGLVYKDTMNKYRKHAIVAILCIAAIITPADPFSMIIAAAPLLLLYEASVLFCKPRPAEEEG